MVIKRAGVTILDKKCMNLNSKFEIKDSIYNILLLACFISLITADGTAELNIDDPATITFAPTLVTEPTFSNVIPPSTSISKWGAIFLMASIYQA